ncbi:MAG TPA: hypothetical protein VHX36_12245 [Candidatus Acidoferrales bacterium]|nr:hypothetical protein [Candidatus Acidoferrales bacterium]
MPAKPGKPKAKPRPPERDYSHRALLDKLGVKPQQKIAVVGVEDASFLKDLAERIPDFACNKPPAGADIIFAAAEDTQALARLKSLAASIAKSGAIWVVYPKGQKHIREIDVIAAGKSAGLTDNKVCKFSETYTALRFVIPLVHR